MFEQLTEEYLSDCRMRGLSRYTLGSYSQTLRHLVAYHGGGDVPTKRVLKAFLSARREKGDAESTLRNRHTALRAFFAWLVAEGEIAANPMGEIPKPQEKAAPVPLVSAEDVAALLKLEARTPFETHRNRAMIVLAYDTGVRVGELIGIRTEDLDMRNGFVQVTGKTGSRIIPFGGKAAGLLRRYLRYRGRHKKAAAAELFVGPNGGLSIPLVQWVLKTYAKRAGVNRIHPHKLRHTFVDSMLRAGASVTDVTYLGGWSDPKQVLTRYGKAGVRERAYEAHRKFSPGDRLG